MRFRPLNEDHAIESVKFSVVFSAGFLPQSVMAIEQNHDQWRESLPARSVADVNIDSNGRNMNAPGIFFAFLRPDGSPSWSMTVALNRIDVECFLYSRWERVWSEAKGYFVKVFQILSEVQAGLEIRAVELTVKDVFVATERDYPLGHLLKSSGRLPGFVFEAGQSWHANSGWFVFEDTRRTLHNLNCDAALNNDAILINISHYQQAGLKYPIKIADGEMGGSKELEGIMSNLHKANKQMMIELLQDEMAGRIGLGVSTNVNV